MNDGRRHVFPVPGFYGGMEAVKRFTDVSKKVLCAILGAEVFVEVAKNHQVTNKGDRRYATCADCEKCTKIQKEVEV